VPRISAFLVSSGSDDDPTKLSFNSEHCFQGFKIAGQGFLFDDTDTEATPISEMMRLLERENYRQRIHPYIGGQEVNDSPTQEYQRHAIDFGDLSLDEAGSWPELLDIVRRKVKPYRDTVNRDAHRVRWWQYGEKRPALRQAIKGLNRVLVNSQVTGQFVFAFLPSNWIFAHTLNIFTFDTYSAFALMQSRIHEIWARFFASSMKDDLRYTPSDCFESFPFPENFETNPSLETEGKAYFEFRADLMVRNNEGLTKTYNRFHDPDERSLDIIKLRELHAAMDRAVLDAYGWTDLKPTCEFVLDFEEDDEDEEGTGGRRRKKPWRYRWPDDFRDEVLARLLELNRQRAEQERLSGATAEGKAKAKKPRRSTKKADGAGQLGMF
jgi:hypothetical protein